MESRRDIFGILGGGAVCGALGAALPWRLRAHAAAGGLSVTPLASDDIVMITGAGGNIVAVRDGGAVTMVDGGSARHAEELLRVVSETFGGRPVRTLFNTHWHPEQTGANTALGEAGAVIVSHANTRLWLGTDVTWPWNDETIQPLPPVGRPTEIIHYDAAERGSGPVRARYGYMLQAHTDGDMYVHFPDSNVLAIGGVTAGDRWPMIDWWTGGWMGGLVEGVETLLQVADAETVIVPADGPLLTRADLEAQRDMYAEMFVRLRSLLFQGLSPEEAVAATPTEGFEPDWRNRDAFAKRAFESLWGYFAPDV